MKLKVLNLKQNSTSNTSVFSHFHISEFNRRWFSGFPILNQQQLNSSFTAEIGKLDTSIFSFRIRLTLFQDSNIPEPCIPDNLQVFVPGYRACPTFGYGFGIIGIFRRHRLTGINVADNKPAPVFSNLYISSQTFNLSWFRVQLETIKSAISFSSGVVPDQPK